MINLPSIIKGTTLITVLLTVGKQIHSKILLTILFTTQYTSQNFIPFSLYIPFSFLFKNVYEILKPHSLTESQNRSSEEYTVIYIYEGILRMFCL